MKINRNPEVKKETVIMLAVCAVIAAGGFVIDPLCGIFALAAAAAAVVIHYIFAKKRYRRIEELAAAIDRILHEEEDVMISDSHEGELSILNSEIRKMVFMLKEQAEQMQKEKENLAAAIEDIFHQMRTPLTAVMIDLELSGSRDLPYEKRISLIREMKKQSERMRWLVESLLKMSKINAKTAVFVKERVKVSDIISKAAEPFLIQMELKGQEFQTDCDDAEFVGDRNWTVEAVANLIKNCMEHTPEGGIIKVSAGENALYTGITVSDTGEGFAKEDIPYLFERFYKGKNASAESIGIGLALSRSIIASQNGVITARNRNSGGAEFIVRFYKTVI